MIYVIADDLTGANDTGVQLAKRGYRTIVSIFNKSVAKNIPEDLDVLVVDTETRELESKTARKIIRNILKRLNINKSDIIYKKADSTLRGNIGCEIEEIMNVLNKDICIFSPSFPTHHRITVGGYLIVQQKPLGISEYPSNDLNQEENSFIPFLLEKQTKFSIGQIDLKEVCKGQKTILKKINDLYQKGNQIIIIDSTNEEHLKNIFGSCLRFDGSVLFSGSAGLAKHFPYADNKNEVRKINIENNKGPFIVVAGSQHPVMEEQIKHLRNRVNFTELITDLEQIFSNKERILDDYTTICIKAIKGNYDLVINTHAIYNEEKSINKKLMLKYNIDFRELEIKIRTFLGELTSRIVNKCHTRNLILIGGDIALGVCRELDISNLTILDELLPGIPLSIANYKNYNLNIVTKAGGFGGEDTLHHLMNKLKNY